MNILFVTSNRLGDAVLSTGILGWLLERHPDARVTVACGPLPAPLFADIPSVVRVAVLHKRPWAGHWRDLWRSAIRTRWDLLVDLRGSPLAWTLPARARRVWKRSATHTHMVEALAQLVGAEPPPAPRLWPTQDQDDRARALLGECGPILALAPAANAIGKQWPAERYAQLAQALAAPGAILAGGRLAVFGTEAERATCAPVLAALPPERTIDLVGATDPALAGACFARCDLYAGNDSGLTHLAAASGVPTLALFGPGLAWKYRPWGPRGAYVSAADDPAREVDVCALGDDAAALALMQALHVATVRDAAVALWERTRP